MPAFVKVMPLASELAEQLTQDAPFPGYERLDTDDAIWKISQVLEPELEARQQAFCKALAAVSSELAETYDTLSGELVCNQQDAAYLLGLAVGQRIKIAALTTVATRKRQRR